jgi:peptidoglycan biosynthesis protein MviN/MurJ (putative lipid II flippase)
MIEPGKLRTGLGVVLNVLDFLAAVFLIFGGGMIAGLHSTATGYVSIGFGLVLIYLSTGMWIGGEWKLVTRLVIYVAALCIVLVVLVILVLVRHEPLAAQSPLPIVLFLFLTNVVLSIAHLRRRRVA